MSEQTGNTRNGWRELITGWFRRTDDVAIGDLNPGAGRGLGIEPLEERIAPGALVVNPPGNGGGTEVLLPDAADHGRAQAIEHSPAIEPPPPINPPPIDPPPGV